MSLIQVNTTSYTGQCTDITREKPCCGPYLRCMRLDGHGGKHLWWSGNKTHSWVSQERREA